MINRAQLFESLSTAEQEKANALIALFEQTYISKCRLSEEENKLPYADALLRSHKGHTMVSLCSRLLTLNPEHVSPHISDVEAVAWNEIHRRAQQLMKDAEREIEKFLLDVPQYENEEHAGYGRW